MTPAPTTNVLSKWRCDFTWSPDGVQASKTVTIQMHATGSADALAKTQARCAMHTGYAGSTFSFGTPAAGWIDR